ncbi:DNA primase [Tamilnaduibacter salinus]|uniref:DNA primase n=1 Tax=Tamilnaduibacter salinus TaxID=1484056 RepID=A0A2U1CXR0_9GAMM|nr:DNA primase [Tamilnaduibacter salinus]PVY77022.1 DNA primase [Tamilnaduibacter salinus]
MSGLIPQRFIEELMDRIDLAELIGGRVQLKKAGANYKARCPFHDEKTPSFNVRPDKGFYHCFGCGAHGDAISFLREMDGLSFTEAVEDLAKRAGLEVPYDESVKQEIQQARTLTEALDFAGGFYRKALERSDAGYAREYLKGRGLDAATIDRYGLGFAPPDGDALYRAAGPDLGKRLIETGTVSDRFGRPRDLFRNRIMFPIRNSRGRTVAFGGRTLGDDKAKYINSPESDVFHKSREIYGLYEARQALRQVDRLLVVEGYMDVIALAQHGIHEAVATLGTATNTDSLQALLRHARHIVFCFDGDTAGFRAADKAMENALELLNDGMHLQFLMLPEGEDPDTLVRREGAEAFRERIESASPLSRFLFDRQRTGLDLTLGEHRGELRTRVKPLLNKMPYSALRDAMWQELRRVSRFDPRERAKSGNGPEPAREEPVEIKVDKATSLCLGLVEAPELAADVQEHARHDRALADAVALADWIQEQGIRDRSALFRSLALDASARQRFFHLFDGLEYVPAREQALATVQDMLQPDNEARRRSRINTLMRRMASGECTDAEREELKRLTSGNGS